MLRSRTILAAPGKRVGAAGSWEGGGGTKILALQSLRVCSLYLCSNILVKVIIYNETIHFLQKVDLIAKEAAPDGVGYFFVC